MSATEPGMCFLHAVRGGVARRLRVPAILLFVLVAQIAPLSAWSPVGGGGALPAHAAALPTITTVSFAGTGGLDGSVTVTISGQHFGSEPPPIPDTEPGSPAYDGYTGQDFGSALALAFTDDAAAAPAPWAAGQTGNHIGLVVSQYTDTSVAFSFGDAYGPEFPYPNGGFFLSEGDPFSVYVQGQLCTGTVSFRTPTTCAPPIITTIRFSGDAANPTIAIDGSGFGSSLPAPTVSGPAGSGPYAGQTFTGDDYTCGVLALTYTGGSAGQAGPESSDNVCPTDGQVHDDATGLLVGAYTTTHVEFTLGSFYGVATPGGLDAGNQFTVTVAGVTCTGSVSYTAPVYCQNSTWGAALTLSQTSGSYQVNQSVSQFIYGAVTERWYRFLVTPGSSVHVQYTGEPGAVLSLHSDLQSAYSALSSPSNAALESARNAPSGFLPQSFLPQSFLPQSFLPQSFLPQSFLPQSFLPQSFLPQSFLPQSFLPQSFLPQSFLPQGFLPGPYSDAPYASLLAVSATPNAAVQTIDHYTWNSFGYMYVRVAAPPSTQAPFSLTVTESGGVCAGITDKPITPPAAAALPTGLTTLILWDTARIDGTASDIAALGAKLGQFAARPEVRGAVVDLRQIAGVDGSGSAEEQADNNPACPTAKNIVASGIKGVVQAYRAVNPGLRYIVLIGDDHSIPFFRYPDRSGLGPESQYYPPVADASAANASLRDNYVLGQDEYGAAVSVPIGDVSLPLPDLAVGRLVRTASEVSHMLDAYMATNGVITPTSSLVTGYDFVADAAADARSELQAGTNVAPDTLISPQGQQPSAGWTANDLRQKLLGSRHDVVFMAGHFSAGGLEAADYATSLSAAEVVSSPVDMANTLILALGCHGGYDIPTEAAAPPYSPYPDWPEAMAEKGATLFSSTGYAYGDTVLTAYGEQLFDNYLRQLRSFSGSGYAPVAVGQAAVAAKQQYLATHASLTGVDQKTLLETTLYGLPMLRVNMTGQHVATQLDPSIVAAAPTVSSGPGRQLGLSIGQTASGSPDIDVQPSLTEQTIPLTTTTGTVTATYLTGPDGGVVARPGEPIFPSQTFNVHVPDQILRGVGFRGGAYSDAAGIIPLTTAVGTETSVGHPAFYSTTFYPTQVWAANFFDAIAGGSERLVTTPAQYRSASAGAIDGTLRRFSDLQFRLFYLPSDWTASSSSLTDEAAAPTIGDVSATAGADGAITFSVRVTSDQAAGTQGVWITYTDPNNPGAWRSIDLSPSGADPDVWTATRSLPSSIVFMVQAVSGTGLVSLSTNAGSYYSLGAPPAAAAGTTIAVQLPAPASGAYHATSGAFTVHLQAAGGAPLPAGQVVTLQLGAQQALGATDAGGNATITMPLDQPPGAYPVVATFAGATAQGTAYTASSSATATFTITPAPTTLVLTPAPAATAVYGGAIPIAATLTDGTGAALVQRTVFFTITGNGQTVTKTAITDASGRAPLGVVQFPVGTYSVAAAFGGADHPVTIAAGGNTVTEADPDFLSSTAPPTTLIVAYPPLYLATVVSTSPPGAVTTGSVVTLTLTVGNHTSATQTIALKATLTYTGSSGALSLTVPLRLRLDAGQTFTRTVRFTITRAFPRGAYALSVTATDGSGDTATSSASLIVS